VVGPAGFEQKVGPVPLGSRLLNVLAGGPLSLRDLTGRIGDSSCDKVCASLKRLWKKGLILRTKRPVFKRNAVRKGAAGVVINTRAVNYYALSDDSGIGSDFVRFSEKMKDGRDSGIKSKAKMILEFLEKNENKAFYSVDIVKAVDINSCDVMSNMRRYEKKGLVFVRGYNSHNRRSPFQRGYILTWIDQDKPRDEAVMEALERANRILTTEATSNVVYERARMIREQLITLNELVSREYLRNVLKCTKSKLYEALKRVMTIYHDIKKVEIFGFSYYYCRSVSDEDLSAQIEMKKNYIRKTKGRDNRLGHNWEVVCEWFIEKFTRGVEFWTQNHRDKIDPRRITLHLLKSVGKRRMNAEVDRVWEVTPGFFSSPVTYVLECKWSIVTKRTLDDFIDVLRWSTDFGTDTENGREVKKGVIPVFGAGAFNPKGKAVVNGRELTLAQYASRMNIQLLKPSDFNKKLREHGVVKKVTVQKICRVCKNEIDIRSLLDVIWKKPLKAQEVLVETLTRNHDVFEFEKVLADKNNINHVDANYSVIEKK